MFWKKKKSNEQAESENRIVINVNNLFSSDFFEMEEKHVLEVLNSISFQNGNGLTDFLKSNAKKYADQFSVYFDTKSTTVKATILLEGTLCSDLHNEALRLQGLIDQELIKLKTTEDYELSSEADRRSLEGELLVRMFDKEKCSSLSRYNLEHYLETFEKAKSLWGTDAHFKIVNKIKDVNFKVFELIFDVFTNADEGDLIQFSKPDSCSAKEISKALKSKWVERSNVTVEQMPWLASKLKVGEIKEILKSKELPTKGKKDELLIEL